MDLEKKLRLYLGRSLRKYYRYSPLKAAVYARDKGQEGWQCYVCPYTSFAKEEFDVEHVRPVVPPEASYVDSLEYFRNMFCLRADGSLDLGNLKLVCKECHAAKTKEENSLRAANGTGAYSESAKAKAKATRIRRLKKRRRKYARKA